MYFNYILIHYINEIKKDLIKVFRMIFIKYRNVIKDLNHNFLIIRWFIYSKPSEFSKIFSRIYNRRCKYTMLHAVSDYCHAIKKI